MTLGGKRKLQVKKTGLFLVFPCNTYTDTMSTYFLT